MSLSVDLPGDVLAALRAEADRRGVTAEELIAETVIAHLAGLPPRRRFALAGIGESSGDRFARDADDLLAEGFGRD